ncbi:hypothetical protein [Anabaena sp. FACHB-1237]|nr:hypothetical protein [Anabaena sp. FACHB-1237]
MLFCVGSGAIAILMVIEKRSLLLYHKKLLIGEVLSCCAFNLNN